MINSRLHDSIGALKGIGEKRVKSYQKLDIYTVEDMLKHLPRRYIDLNNIYSLAEAPSYKPVAVRAVITKKTPTARVASRRGLRITSLYAEGGGIVLELVLYNANKYALDNILVGQEYIFYGLIESGIAHRRMKSPNILKLEDATGMLPIYPAVKGLTSKRIGADIAQAIKYVGKMEETLPREILKEHSLLDINSAYVSVHLPKCAEDVENGRRRLVFEELLIFSLAVASIKTVATRSGCVKMQKYSLREFKAILPFVPTQDQRDAVNSAIDDMCSGLPMNRLLEGDVGSGKTLVAAALCYFAHLNGYASAVMAPTEVLAEQHYKFFGAILEKLGLRVALLTGATRAADKRKIKAELLSGEVQVCIGTHALLTEDVLFSKLGLVVTDEQHRFGVHQRMTLAEKGKAVHTLVMSATPIPRTLGLVMYGDMQISTIRQMPSGRQPVKTYLIDYSKLKRAYCYIKKHLDEGLQAYIVCPLVDGAEVDAGARVSAVELYEELKTGFFANYRVGLMHGRLRSAEKDAVMRDFSAGNIDVLISTTVIEVGIDVPNAAIMLINNAECFGLSQLHQLRGRVGRGKASSSCILVSSAEGKQSIERLRMLRDNTDGFAIAEYDLKSRGAGDFFGTRQHGIARLKIADLAGDIEIIECVSKAARELCANLYQYPELKLKVDKMLNGAAVL